MKLLVSKKDAHVPLYLSIACDELRVFGLFEKVRISQEVKCLDNDNYCFQNMMLVKFHCMIFNKVLNV